MSGYQKNTETKKQQHAGTDLTPAPLALLSQLFVALYEVLRLLQRLAHVNVTSTQGRVEHSLRVSASPGKLIWHCYNLFPSVACRRTARLQQRQREDCGSTSRFLNMLDTFYTYGAKRWTAVDTWQHRGQKIKSSANNYFYVEKKGKILVLFGDAVVTRCHIFVSARANASACVSPPCPCVHPYNPQNK